MDEFKHISVLLNEAIDSLNIKENGIYVDGTLGGGGHSLRIAQKLKSGKLICIDRDPDAIAAAKQKLHFDCVSVVQSRFSEINGILNEMNIEHINGLLLDLGTSSHQLDVVERGFSYHGDAPLDMRMSQQGQTAADLVNALDEKQLAEILFRYADEKFAFKIAKRIVEQRKINPITTTGELAQLVSECYPSKFKRDGHPARKTFQALRIAVNDELREVEKTINSAFERLEIGGRIVIITFHSIEDRIVKQEFAKFCSGCTCPKDFPVCVCGKKPRAKLVYKKPVCPSEKELADNPRSRSAKLRVIERII